MTTSAKTEYQVFKLIDIEWGILPTDPEPDPERDRGVRQMFLPVGSAVAHGPKQAIKEVASKLPEGERLGTYRATPTSSWHEGTATAKPAELAVS